MRKQPAFYDICELQAGTYLVWDQVEAFEIPLGLALRSAAAPDPIDPDADDVPAPTKAYLELTLMGWHTLVELYAYKYPGAYKRIADKLSQLPGGA